MQRNFALYVTGVIFTCKYFKFGLNTTGLSQSHFRNLSACSIIFLILRRQGVYMNRIEAVNWNNSILSLLLNIVFDRFLPAVQ